MGFLASIGLESRQQRAWAMYDWANSAFATTIMASMLPIYYHDVAADGLPEHLRTAYWGYTAGVALLITALLSPVLGAIADMLGSKKKFLTAFMLLGAVATLFLWYVGRGDWMLASLLFMLGNIGFAGSNVFYDALLPSVARDDEMDRVSAAGYAVGYIGGGLLLAVNLAWFLKPELFGFADKGVAVRAAFASVGVWWLLFTLPVLRHVPEPASDSSPLRGFALVSGGFSRLRRTWGELRRYRDILVFLVAFWFYSDGVGTIIKMATIYGREIGIGQTHLIGALLLVQFLGIPATFAFGWLAGRLGAKPSLMLSLLVYAGICVLGYFMTSSWHFWALAVLVATVQGGCQALSRSLYAAMVPKSRTTEFFAFFSISIKFAGIAGPLLFGAVSQTFGGSRNSILFLVSFFVIGMILLLRVDIERGRQAARLTDQAAA